MKIISYGAAGQVTGSCHLVETGGTRFLFDCGLFQGTKKVDQQNLSPLGFDPKDLDFVLLSHAHLDHCGRLPLLVKEGFMGPIYTTKPTRDLAELILNDSAHLQSYQENPLYTLEDVEQTMHLFYTLSQEDILRIKGLEISFHHVGHLLGASWIKVKTPEKTIAFSGDLGRYESPFFADPVPLGEVDLLLLETTNAAKVSPSIADGLEDLYQKIREAYLSGRTILIPAFSIGRTEEILSGLSRLSWTKKDEIFREIPLNIDSSLAQAGLKVYKEHEDFHTIDLRDLNPPNLRLVSKEESFTLDKNTEAKVLLSASGMMEGGHILHHASSYLPDPSTLLIFVGYQGEETIGRRILEGEKNILIDKSPVHIGAEIVQIHGLSGHGDQRDLLRFLSTAEGLEGVVLLHGQPESMNEFESILTDKVKVLRAVHGVNVLENYDGS